MPNGDVKDPTQTGKGEHGQFKPIFRASLSMKTGRIVQLRCHARPSHTLRIAPENKDKDVEQDGGAGEWAQWKLTVTNDNFWQPTIQLENIKVTGQSVNPPQPALRPALCLTACARVLACVCVATCASPTAKC
jgi:hypothetical protein